jgi:hypothetical protein
MFSFNLSGVGIEVKQNVSNSHGDCFISVCNFSHSNAVIYSKSVFFQKKRLTTMALEKKWIVHGQIDGRKQELL